MKSKPSPMLASIWNSIFAFGFICGMVEYGNFQSLKNESTSRYLRANLADIIDFH